MSILTPLKNIQKDAQAWMKDRENNPLHEISGGMFLDDPGMGKTLSLLSVILTNPILTHQNQVTLVVCPSNVISVWQQEIAKHTNLSKDKIFVYHGAKRKSNYINNFLLPITKPLIVLTSYGIVRNECIDFTQVSQKVSYQQWLWLSSKTANPRLFKNDSIFNHFFSRIILDEAHFIKDRKTKASISVNHLQGSSRWVVTATPLSNHLDEDFPYFRFLGLIQNWKHWRAILPATRDTIKESNLAKLADGIKLIQGWKKDLVLRRDKSILNLPIKRELVHYIEPSQVENDFYQALYKYSMTRINELHQQQIKLKNKHLQAYAKLLGANVLVLILRLRQACLNPWFVVEQIKRLQAYLPQYIDGTNSSNQKPTFTLEVATKMLNFFNENRNRKGECPSCLDIEADTIAKPCGHKLCYECWGKILEKTPICPICRVPVIETIKTDDLDFTQQMTVEKLLNTIDEEPTFDTELEQEQFDTSSKVQAALDMVEQYIDHTKIIIVSQWVKMLDYTQRKLEEAGYDDKVVTRIDGKVSLEERTQIINKFQNDNTTKICLISLTCSAEGITLIRSNRMIYLDQWWNELGKPDQMSNRIHRIGQDKEVEIVHLRVKNTIEDKISALHQRKNKIIGFSQGKESLHSLIDLPNQTWLDKVHLLAAAD